MSRWFIWLFAVFFRNVEVIGRTKQNKRLRFGGVHELTNDFGSATSCPRIAFLKIQKTGSSVLGDAIMPNLAKLYGQTSIGEHHFEFNHVNKAAPGCVFTMLRDPVERFFSEFTMLRSKSKLEGPGELTQDQWDWHANDLMELRSVQALKPISLAITAYLLSPNNPSRNRQALYLLGFDRVACRDTCCGVCSNHTFNGKKGGYPAHRYNWDRDHGELLARAKRNLLSLRAYGITECFPESMKVIGSALGWNPAITELLGSVIHLRKQDKSNLAKDLLGFDSVSAFHSNSSWRHFVPSDLEAQVRKVNRVDNELVQFARQQFWERQGARCSDV